MKTPLVSTHLDGGIARKLLGLDESPTAQVEASRYLKKWSGPSGFLTADGNGAKRYYRLKEAS